MIRTPFIKTRYDCTTAFIVTFNSTELPDSVYIPGERDDTVVYPYRNRPMMCHICLGYGHTIKYCKSAKVCKNYGSVGHVKEECGGDMLLSQSVESQSRRP